MEKEINRKRAYDEDDKDQRGDVAGRQRRAQVAERDLRRGHKEAAQDGGRGAGNPGRRNDTRL